MQAVIPKAKFNNYTVEWNPIEVFDKDLIKITFVDADTGELLNFDEIPLDVTIGYLGEDGVYRANGFQDLYTTNPAQ